MTAGREVISKNKEWGTPKKYVDAVREVFRADIALDPCSNKHSITDADIEYTLPEKDGLKESWNYLNIYVNPPYGRDRERKTTIGQWLERCAQAHEEYGSEVMALVPVATNTGHWKRSIYGRANAVCFLSDTRLRFLEDGEDIGKGAPMACAMIYWGDHYERFHDVFIRHGAVVDMSHLKMLHKGFKDISINQ
ncbi:N-6 DNA methylase [archaeon]|nr:N-6 DNA methylase [archaeon]